MRSGFLTSAAEAGASIFKMVEVSRHKSVETLRPQERREAVRAIGHSEYAEGDTLMDETSLSQDLPESLKKALQNSMPSRMRKFDFRQLVSNE